MVQSTSYRKPLFVYLFLRSWPFYSSSARSGKESNKAKKTAVQTCTPPSIHHFHLMLLSRTPTFSRLTEELTVSLLYPFHVLLASANQSRCWRHRRRPWLSSPALSRCLAPTCPTESTPTPCHSSSQSEFIHGTDNIKTFSCTGQQTKAKTAPIRGYWWYMCLLSVSPYSRFIINLHAVTPKVCTHLWPGPEWQLTL